VNPAPAKVSATAANSADWQFAPAPWVRTIPSPFASPGRWINPRTARSSEVSMNDSNAADVLIVLSQFQNTVILSGGACESASAGEKPAVLLLIDDICRDASMKQVSRLRKIVREGTIFLRSR
jgi:hypothetical protein